MHLLICSISKDIPRYEVEDIILHSEDVRHILWLKGENGQSPELTDNPVIGAGILSAFNYEEENIVFVKIVGLDNARDIIRQIKQISGITGKIHQFIIPVIV